MSLAPRCTDRQTYITLARINLENPLLDALNDIRNTLQPSANFVVSQSGAFSYRDYNLLGTLPQGSIRVKEFEPVLYEINFGRGKRGNYHPPSGRIFLNEGNWCRQCLIHETLHSVSIFAANVHIGDRYPFLREGLTEFLTGYVMWQNYPRCYEAWKQKAFPQWCALSEGYGTMARIWYTFCRFVEFAHVRRLFFGDGTQNWGVTWSRFLDAIRTGGYHFGNPMRNNLGRLQDRFLGQCKASFGRAEVERILEMESSDFEYENLL